LIPTMLIIQQWRAINGIVLANPDIPMAKINLCGKTVNQTTNFGGVVPGATT